MNDQDFKNLVTRMRQAQKIYETVRKSGGNPSQISRAKEIKQELERDVDRVCSPEVPLVEQPKLFE